MKKKVTKEVAVLSKAKTKIETRQKKDPTRLKGNYHLDLRQDIAWDNYVDPRSSTFNNASQSALKAGYTPSTAKNIMLEKWWINKVEMLIEMLPRAEEVIMEDLNLNTTLKYYDKKGKTLIEVVDPKLRRIRQEASFFVAETVGRRKYHKKMELESHTSLSLVEGNELIDNLFRQGQAVQVTKKK